MGIIVSVRFLEDHTSGDAVGLKVFHRVTGILDLGPGREVAIEFVLVVDPLGDSGVLGGPCPVEVTQRLA